MLLENLTRERSIRSLGRSSESIFLSKAIEKSGCEPESLLVRSGVLAPPLQGPGDRAGFEFAEGCVDLGEGAQEGAGTALTLRLVPASHLAIDAGHGDAVVPVHHPLGSGKPKHLSDITLMLLAR